MSGAGERRNAGLAAEVGSAGSPYCVVPDNDKPFSTQRVSVFAFPTNSRTDGVALLELSAQSLRCGVLELRGAAREQHPDPRDVVIRRSPVS